MNKNLQIVLKIIRWIFGIFFSVLSIGGFASGDFISASIVLLIGLLILPPTGSWFFGLFSGKSNFKAPNLSFLSTSSKNFLKDIDINNDNDFINNIDNLIKKSKNPINDKQMKNIGKQLYKQCLSTYLDDLYLSDKEKSKLQEIIDYFKLTTIEITQIKNSLNQKTVETLVKKSFDDKILTDKEQYEIIELAKYLELPLEVVEKIKSKLTSSLLQVALNEKLNDNKLSPSEESELLQILDNLKIERERISEIIPQKSLKQLAYAKLLWSLDNGLFYSIPNPPITLQKKEECYLAFQSQLLESKIVHKGYSYGSSGISIPIAKGVRFRTSAGRARPIKEEVTIKYLGKLFLTNLRIVFSTTGNKSFQIPFSKLLTFNVYSDGLEFVLERKSYLLKISSNENELFATGLTSSIRNYLDNQNETVLQAMKEIEENNSFIDL